MSGVDMTGVAAVAAGSILAYAGVKGYSLPQAIQYIVQGKSPATLPQTTGISSPSSSSSSAAASTAGASPLGGPGPGGISASDWAQAQAAGGRYGVDPYLLVAIGFHETHWGTLGDGRPPPAGHGNVLGVGSYDSGSVGTWSGLTAQLNKGAEILAKHGVHTIADVQAGKASWWATDPSWAQGVASWYLKIRGGK